MATSDVATPPGLEQLDLQVTGMTCASCAAHIEKQLNQVNSAAASVNYALGRAHVEFDPAVATVDDLLVAVEQAGYRAEAPRPTTGTPLVTTDGEDDPEVVALRHRLAVCVALTVPVVAVSMIPALQFRNWQWFALTLASPVAVWGAWPFHVAAWRNARHRTATMDTLVSIGVIAAYAWSLAALFFGDAGMPGMVMSTSLLTPPSGGLDHTYLEVAAVVPTFVLLGRYLEARAKRRAGAALDALLSLGAKEATLLDAAGRERNVPVDDLQVGDVFVVRPGERVATDGVVIDGTAAVDVSMLTGESIPDDVAPGDPVAGATVNMSGKLTVKVTKVGADTQLARMAKLVSDAQSGKAGVQRLADRVSAVFVPVVLLISLGTLLTWALLGESDRAFTAAVAVLIVACPCALGLATPVALLVGTGRAAQLGILIKGPEVLESTRVVDTLVLDKTGTVTTGKTGVVNVAVDPDVDRRWALQLVTALESSSEHPVAQAVANLGTSAASRLSVHAFHNQPGLGVTGTVDGVHVTAGSPAWVQSEGLVLPPPLQEVLDDQAHQGHTLVVAGWDGQIHVVVSVSDVPKTGAREAVAALEELGLSVVMLTGDSQSAAQAVATSVGIDDVSAGVLPEGKVAAVKALQSDGRVVAMVGDGVNDSAALATADLGISMGTGTDAAIEASDLTVVSGDLTIVPDAIRLSRRTLAVIKGNLFWAFAYNVAAVPVAAMGWLNPMLAAAAMACSSLFVVTNSLRLRRFTPQAPMASTRR
jgi:Cu+-exporting ATPase